MRVPPRGYDSTGDESDVFGESFDSKIAFVDAHIF